MPISTIWRILKKHLKWKPYRLVKVNRLTERNKEDRLHFCRWFLNQEEGFEQKVIWSDEKWFLRHPAPNSQNERIWAPWHPEETEDCHYQGDTKVMAWAAVVDGGALQIRWMIDEDGRPVMVNSDRYLEMLRGRVWPEVRGRAAQRRWWWMQDGATPHTTDNVLDFLNEKFHGRIISRRCINNWPPYSPDLNVMDFFFWGWALMRVRQLKPTTLEELMEIVEDVARTVPLEMVRKAATNVRKRCRACIQADGGHFEHFLKSM